MRNAPRVMRAGATSVSVVMPVFNESHTVVDAVSRLLSAFAIPGAPALEVVVVDDGSTDGTSALLASVSARDCRVRVVSDGVNRGKGSAVRAGFARSTGDIVVVLDADLEYDARDVLGLVAPILRGDADAAIGSRFDGSPRRALRTWHAVANKGLTLLSNLASGLWLRDMECCLKAVRRDALTALPLRTRRFGIEPELVARFAQAELRVAEVAVSYAPRSVTAGKKITWWDGIAACWHIVRCNWGPGRPHPVRLRPFTAGTQVPGTDSDAQVVAVAEGGVLAASGGLGVATTLPGRCCP